MALKCLVKKHYHTLKHASQLCVVSCPDPFRKNERGVGTRLNFVYTETHELTPHYPFTHQLNSTRRLLTPTCTGGSCFDTLECCLQHMVCVVFVVYIQHAWSAEAGRGTTCAAC